LYLKLEPFWDFKGQPALVADDCLTLENVSDTLCRNVGNELLIYAA